MADGWEALRIALLYVGWPGLLVASGYAIAKAASFYRSLRHSAPGLLVLLTTAGWVVTLAGAAFVTTLYLGQDPERAGPIVTPIFILWAGSMVTIVWVVHRWGEETATLDTYYGELERMERMKSGFINHVAHELNTPMTPLRMQLALFRRGDLGPLTDRQGKAVERMERSVDRLSTLVEQVLLASLLQGGRMQLQAIDEDVGKIAAEAAAAAAGGTFEVRPSGRVTAFVDRGRFGYAVQALLEHVARHSGGGVVDVRRNGPWAEIAIDYAGPRIRQRDFEKFSDPIAAQERDGLAIELFNVHGIVMLHGGRIDASEGPLIVRVPVHAPPPRPPVRPARLRREEAREERQSRHDERAEAREDRTGQARVRRPGTDDGPSTGQAR